MLERKRSLVHHDAEEFGRSSGRRLLVELDAEDRCKG